MYLVSAYMCTLSGIWCVKLAFSSWNYYYYNKLTGCLTMITVCDHLITACNWYARALCTLNTVQLMFNFTHARVRLWNCTLNISIYLLITCEHSKEQWRKHIFTCTNKSHTKCTCVEYTSANLLVRIYSWTCVEYTLMKCARVECIHLYGVH